MADNVVHQCRCGEKIFVALIANMFVADLLVLVWCLRQDASEEVADSSKKEGVATNLLPLLTHQQIIGVLTL